MFSCILHSGLATNPGYADINSPYHIEPSSSRANFNLHNHDVQVRSLRDIAVRSALAMMWAKIL